MRLEKYFEEGALNFRDISALLVLSILMSLGPCPILRVLINRSRADG